MAWIDSERGCSSGEQIWANFYSILLLKTIPQFLHFLSGLTSDVAQGGEYTLMRT